MCGITGIAALVLVPAAAVFARRELAALGLADLLRGLSFRTESSIVTDQVALRRVGIDPNLRVVLQADKQSLAEILDRVLQPNGLAYRVMSEEILGRLGKAPVVPLVGPDDSESGTRTAQALVDGGLTVVEVVLRTPAAIGCLGEIAQNVPGAIIGAGTVLTVDQAEKVIAAGAKFIVCPGLHEPIVRLAQEAGELPEPEGGLVEVRVLIHHLALDLGVAY